MLPYFESIGRIQNIDKYLACLRSSNASIKIGTDSTSKIQEIYEENMLVIVDSCDTTVFYKGDSKFATTKDAPPEGKCYVHIRGEFIVIDNVA